MNKLEKRLMCEWNQLQKNPIEHITAGPINENNIHVWEATIHGPKDTPYEGGIFYITITFPEKYPFVPMKMRFKTPIYHPNINRCGDICLDILKDAWAPVLNVSKVLLSVCSLLSDPNPDDPLEKGIAKIFIEDRDKYNRMGRNHTYTHAVLFENKISTNIVSKQLENSNHNDDENDEENDE